VRLHLLVLTEPPWPTGPDWEPVGDELVLIEVPPQRRAGHGRYWRPDGLGYTNDPTRAGHYSAGSDWCAAAMCHPNARLIPLRMARPLIVAALRESLQRLGGEL
jgi:hypothetical protein